MHLGAHFVGSSLFFNQMTSCQYKLKTSTVHYRATICLAMLESK